MNIKIPNLTILTEEQVYGKNKLKIFDVIDPRAAVTDTAILRGAYVSDYHVDGDDTLAGRTGYYWLQNSDGDEYARVVGMYGDSCWKYCYRYRRDGSVRAALPSSFILENASEITIREDGLQSAQYGYYLGSSVSKSQQTMLETLYINGLLTELGKGYTFDGRKYEEFDKAFLPEEQIYYGHEGKVYARVRANSYYDGKEFTLSNGEKYKDDDYVWVMLEPVTWIRHPEDDWFIFEKLIISGIRFYEERGGYDEDFNRTELKWYLDNYLAKDLVNPIIYIYLNNYKNKKAQEQKQTVTNFIYKDKDGKTIKRVKVKVRVKKTESN